MKSAGVGAMAAGAVPTALSRSKVAGANDRIRIAVVGCGGMGNEDLADFLKVKGVECVALCDVDASHLAKTQATTVAAAGQKAELLTGDFRRVMDVKDIDAVIVATPDHWHALPMIAACQAGKDVYTEKPLARTIPEGRAMLDAARKYDRVVQVGTQNRSAPHVREAVEYVRSGKLGNIRMVRVWAYLDWVGAVPPVPDSPAPEGVDYDMWLGPAPKRPFNQNRFHFNFRWFWDYAGGLLTDWGAHQVDIANFGMGNEVPASAASFGGKLAYPDDAEETPDTQQVIWQYASHTMIWEHAVGIGRGPETREHGVAYHGENGILIVDRGGWEVHSETDRYKRPRRIYRMIGEPRHEKRSRDDMHLLHVKNFIECMRSRERPHADVEIGHNSIIASHIGNLSLRLGCRIDWDKEKERPIGNREAEKFMQPHYRAPWKLVV